MSADDIKTVLTEQDIDDIILTGGYRNAAGGIYATSVYAFAKEIAVAAVEASRAPAAESPDSLLTEAASELRVCAEEIKAGHTIGGEWPDGEDDARIAHNRLHNLASALERMAAIAAIQADRASRADPVAWRIRYRSEPGMIGHYPWSFTDRIRGARLDTHYEYEPLYVAPSPQGDAERLEYLMRRLSGAASRYYVGEMGDTGNLDLFRAAIDERIATAARSTPAKGGE